MQGILYCRSMLLKTCRRVSFSTAFESNELLSYSDMVFAYIKKHLSAFVDLGYEDLTRRLVTALQDSISADINGATENEVKV